MKAARTYIPPRRIRSALLALLLTGLAGCGGVEAGRAGPAPARGQSGDASHGPGLWAVSDMAAILEGQPVPAEPWVYDARAATVRLFGAGNETVAFQLGLDAPAGAPLGRVSLEWSDLRGPGTIPASAVRVMRQWPVTVRQYPGWYLRTADRPAEPAGFYDVLIPADAPRHGMPWNVPPAGRLALWVDVAIPRDAGPGVYRGTLTLTARQAAPRRVAVELEVYDFVLPDARPLLAVGGFGHRTLFAHTLRRGGTPFEPVWMDRQDPLVRQGLVGMRQLMTLAHEHRLDLVDRDLRPVLKRDMDGQVRLDWTDYDAVVSPYIDGTAYVSRIGQPGWPAPVHQGWPDPDTYGGPDSETYRQTLQQVLGQTVAHFAERGWEDRLFFWPTPTPPRAGDAERFIALARLARQVAPEVPILCPLPLDVPALAEGAPPADLPTLADLLAPPGERFDPRPHAAAWASGAPPRRYLVPGAPPYVPSLAVFAAPADARALAWLADRYGLRGVWIGDVLDWQGDPAQPGSAGQAGLFHPGTLAGLDGVLPSARLKRLRRGLQDAAYLGLLRQRGRAGLADGLAMAMTPYAGLDATGDHYLDARLDGWVRPSQAWSQARRLLAEEVRSAVRPEMMDSQHLLAQRLEWRRLLQEIAPPGADRVTFRPIAGRADGSLGVRVRVDLHNPLARSVQAALSVGGLPAGIQAGPLPRPITLSPAGRATAELDLWLGDPQPTGHGHVPLDLALSLDGQRPEPLVVDLPLVRAAGVHRPIVIDGDLADWPMRGGNVAGRFRLVGRRGQEGPGLAGRQTQVFVLRDADTLYIAFRCDAPGPVGPRALPDNHVRFDNLLAVGEDLLEIVLDPGGAADQPAQLYHLVLKANGTARATRGIRADRPLGPVEAWPVDIRSAVRVGEGVWFAEIAIPLSAFGEQGGSAVWGANFARHDPAAGESSHWARARCLYTPGNLGILLMGPP